MRKATAVLHILIAVLFPVALATLPALAQQIQGLPEQSQGQTITQTVGVSTVTIDYHRPQVRGRKVWGSLVPFGQVWRAGANENTTISFSDPVKIEGQDLAAGIYGLHMLPGEREWQVIFSTNSTSWGSFSYDEAEDALRVSVKPQKAPVQEVLQYRFDHLTAEGGIIVLHWEKFEVPFEFEVDTPTHAMAKIRRDLRSLPGFSWQGWQSAANYCLQNNIEHEDCMTWADRALGMEENFNTLQVKAGLLQRAGKDEEALEITNKSIEFANEQQANMLGYQFMGRDDVDKALEIFAKNTRDHPGSWNVWDSLGEGQANKGLVKEAIANYSKALELAPHNQKQRIAQVLKGLMSPQEYEKVKASITPFATQSPRAAISKKTKKVGDEIKWTGYKSINSDDCVSIPFVGTTCHKVKYRFEFRGRVANVDHEYGEYDVHLTSVRIVSQDLVSPMYWTYKNRAQSWANQQERRTVEFKYIH